MCLLAFFLIELAAKNWIAASELSQASTILAKRSDASSLRVSSFLALKAGEVDKSRTMALHCVQVCLNTTNQECLDRLATEIQLPEVSKACQEAKTRLLKATQKSSFDELSDNKPTSTSTNAPAVDGKPTTVSGEVNGEGSVAAAQEILEPAIPS